MKKLHPAITEHLLFYALEHHSKVTKMKTRSVDRSTKSKNRSKRQNEPYAVTHQDYLTLLSKSKNKDRRNKLIDVASSGELSAVMECITNIINGNVPLSQEKLKQLRRHKNILRSLAKKCYPNKQKKSVLKQKGGFLPALLPLALKAVTSFVLPMLTGK